MIDFFIIGTVAAFVILVGHFRLIYATEAYFEYMTKIMDADTIKKMNARHIKHMALNPMLWTNANYQHWLDKKYGGQ